MIYGRNAVFEALVGLRAKAVRDIWATEGAAKERPLEGVELRIATAAEIEQRCGSDAHQGVCAEAGPYPYADAGQLIEERDPLIVVLDHVQDPQNLGAICRTAECVGATGVVIHERGSAVVTPAACKASAGAVEHIRIAEVRNVADFIAAARQAGIWCYGASAPTPSARASKPSLDARDALKASSGGRDLPERSLRGPEVVSYDAPDYSGAVALVLGSEGQGLRPRVAAACDQLVSLPMRGRIQSLSVSAAAAALLYRILQDRASGQDLSVKP